MAASMAGCASTSLWGATWGTNRTESGGMDAMARIVEVARPSHDVAWSLDVVGPPCPSAACEQKDDSGWHMYSVERFFDAPLVFNVTCTATTIAFETVDAIKRSERRPGAWSLHERTAEIGTHEVVGRGAFEFKPHWRAARVVAARPRTRATRDLAYHLVVSNDWGAEATHEVACPVGS